jgi:arginine decarboxylase
MNAIYLPKYNKENHCTSGFLTGAYQETIGGYGGLHHCLIPQPKHILINRDKMELSRISQNNKRLMSKKF